MIYEHLVSGGWIGFDTVYSKHFERKIPRLGIGITQRGSDKVKVISVLLIRKNTEILPDLYKAIGHYLDQRNEIEEATIETASSGGESSVTKYIN